MNSLRRKLILKLEILIAVFKTACDQKYEIDLKDNVDYFPVVQSIWNTAKEAHLLP